MNNILNTNRHKVPGMRKNVLITFIRHAQSIFNQATQNQAIKLGIHHLQWEQRMKNKNFCKNVCFNYKFFDCGLTQKGVIQCQQFSNQFLTQALVDLVLVSPLNRALQTAHFLFLNKNIPKIVQPILAESCRFACDGLKTQGLSMKKKKYSNFNFDKILEQKYAYTISETKIRSCDNILASKSDQQKQREIANMIQNRYLFENDQQLRNRAWEVKQMLKSYGEKYRNIVVVSHWYILTTIMSKSFSKQNQNLDLVDIQNCRTYTYELDDLLKIR